MSSLTLLLWLLGQPFPYVAFVSVDEREAPPVHPLEDNVNDEPAEPPEPQLEEPAAPPEPIAVPVAPAEPPEQQLEEPAVAPEPVVVNEAPAKSQQQLEPRNDGTVAPDLSVAGSTDGSAEAKIGAAWFIPIEKKRRQHTVTLDVGVQVKDGASRAFNLDRNGPAVPNAWTLGFSYGQIHLHDGKSLVGLGVPLGSVALEEKAAAASQCSRVCGANKSASGCSGFLGEIEMLQKAKLRTDPSPILIKRWPDLDATDADAIRARVNEELAFSGASCNSDKARLEQPILALAEATEESRADAWAALALGIAKAAETCKNECAQGADTAECRRATHFHAAISNHKALPGYSEEFNGEKLCAAGVELFDRLGNQSVVVANVRAARYPKLFWSVGASGGLSPHKFLRRQLLQPVDPTNVDAGTYTRLSDVTEIRGAASIGGSLAYVHAKAPARGFTVEGLAIGSVGWQDKDTTARWCEPQEGAVGSPTGPSAEACKERPYGQPSLSIAGDVLVLLGWAETRRGFFRVAAGPRWKWSVDRAPRISGSPRIEVPMSFNLTAARRQAGKLEYDGVIRVTPFAGFAWRYVPDASTAAATDVRVTYDPVVGVNFQLLGKRSLFSTRFDQL